MHYDIFSFTVLLSDAFATFHIFIAHIGLLVKLFDKVITPTQLPQSRSQSHPLIHSSHTHLYIFVSFTRNSKLLSTFPSSPDHSNPSFLTSTFHPSLIILILLCLTPVPSSSCHHGRSFPSLSFISILCFLFNLLGSVLPVSSAWILLFCSSNHSGALPLVHQERHMLV